MGSDNGPMLANGLPDMSNEKSKDAPLISPLFIGFLSIPRVIGLAAGLGIYFMGSTEKYQANMAPIIAKDMHWLYLGLVSISMAINFVNLLPAAYKGRIMKGNSGNLRSNMYIFKMIGEKAAGNYITMEEEGNVGKYNRGNRSLHHMVENFGTLMAGFFLVGSVFPFPTFCLAVLFSVGRIVHQAGYTTGYGAHGLGFMMHMICNVTLEGLAAIVFARAYNLL